jgi:hypothetical protein
MRSTRGILVRIAVPHLQQGDPARYVFKDSGRWLTSATS